MKVVSYLKKSRRKTCKMKKETNNKSLTKQSKDWKLLLSFLVNLSLPAIFILLMLFMMTCDINNDTYGENSTTWPNATLTKYEKLICIHS